MNNPHDDKVDALAYFLLAISNRAFEEEKKRKEFREALFVILFTVGLSLIGGLILYFASLP